MFLTLAPLVTRGQSGLGSIVTTSTDLTCASTNRLVIARASVADITIVLPPASATGQQLTFIIDDATHRVTIRPSVNDALVDPSCAAFMAGGSCARGEMIGVTSTGNGVWFVTSFFNAHCINWLAHAPPAPLPDSLAATYGGSTNAVLNARTEWVALNGEGQTATTQTLDDATVITRNIALRTFYVQVTPAPGANESVSFKIKRVASGGALPGVAQSLMITIAGAAVTGNDTANRVECSAGDIVYIEIIGSANCASRLAAWGIEAVKR